MKPVACGNMNELRASSPEQFTSFKSSSAPSFKTPPFQVTFTNSKTKEYMYFELSLHFKSPQAVEACTPSCANQCKRPFASATLSTPPSNSSPLQTSSNTSSFLPFFKFTHSPRFSVQAILQWDFIFCRFSHFVPS